MEEDNTNSEDAAVAGTGKGGGGHCEAEKPGPPIPPSKPKSCKGCLFYSTLGHSKSKNPTCLGIPGTYDKLTPLILRLAESAASERGTSKGGFIYCCLGYSVYFDGKSSSADSQNNTPKMPYCHGLEFLEYRPATATESKGHEHATPQPQGHEHATPQPQGHEHATPQPQGHERATPQPQSNYKPGHVRGVEYLNRVRKNMSVVASGVTSNLKRLGNYAKETLDDVLDSNRRGPK